jgi:hypothetical protein
LFSYRGYSTSDILQLSVEENGILITEFSKNDVLDDMSQMEHIKASSLYGFPAEFYQTS